MHNHYSQSVSAHRRIISTMIKPSSSRIAYSQTRSKSNTKFLNSTPLSGYLDSALSKQVSEIPMAVVQRYCEESYLMKNHEKLMNSLTFVSGETRKILQYNYLQVSEMEIKTQFQQNNQGLIFRMFETLNDLDKKIVQELFKNEEGQQQKKYFRFDTFIRIIDTMNDLVSNILKNIDDKAIALFIEQIWKFWVFILDLNTQWSKDRYQALVDGQIENYQEQMKQLERDNQQLQEKFTVQQKAYQFKLVVEQKRIMTLREENHRLSQQYNNLEDQLSELSNIDAAKGDLQKIASKLHEMDMNFLRFDKEINESHNQAAMSMKQLAKLIATKPEIPKTPIQQYYELLDLKSVDQNPFNYLLINPLISQINMNFYNTEQKNDKQMASDFIQFVFVNLQKNPVQSSTELFLLWIHSDEQNYVNTRVELLKKLCNIYDPYSSVVKLILGISSDYPVSYKVLEDTIKLMKLVEISSLQNCSKSRPSIIEKFQNCIDLEAESNLTNISSVIPRELIDMIELEVMEQDKSLKLIQIMNIMIRFFSFQEKAQWEKLSKFYQHNVDRMDFRLEETEQFYSIDNFLLWQLIILHKKQNKLQGTEQFMNQLYLIWLNHPRCLVKPQPEMSISIQQSPIKRQQSMQRSTPLLRKQNTILSESSRKK